MKNFVQPGEALDLTAPTGGVVAGMMYKIGAIIAVAAAAAAEGAAFAGYVEGVFDLPSDTGAAWAVGDTVYLLANGAAFTKTATSNTKAGVAVTAKASAETTGRIRLIPSI